MSDLKFKDRVVLITGAGGGLGRAYALEFSKRGAKVVVNDLGGSIRGEGGSNSAADKVVEEIKAAGGIAVANYDSVENGAKIVDTAIKNFGRIDIIINNAGILRDVSFAKMTDQDWELLQKVHLNGTYAVTKAAWPHMLKQKYGRIIMVTSAAGLYGNFGQSHYSAVKMAVVGFANTLAQEGKKFNIRVNTIAPLAGSRMTETVLPPNLIAALKPEYVAPLVLYLCHETNDENGGIFEVGAGWISKVRWQRTNGVMFPLNEKFTIESVADKIDAINDWKDATYPTTPRDAFGPIMANIEAGKAADNNAAPAPAAEEGGKKSKKGGEDGGKKVDVATALAHNYPEIKYSYTEKELILYNLGIGAGSNPLDKSELNFIYEGADNFQAIPTFGVIPPAAALAEIINTPGLSFNPMMLLHGEQYLEVKKTIPTTGNLISKAKISNIYDKGSGALVVLDVKTFDDKGEELFFNQSSLFIRGIGGFGGKKGPSEKEENYEPPQCPPAVVHREKTMENQAALYRLSGDTNPLHIDPALASMGGFSSPILHGLCTFGYGARAVIKHFADNDFKRFKSIRARFVKSVYPGETLVTEMWPINNGNTIIFRVKVAERGDIVLAHAAIHLHPVAGTAAATPSSSPAADAAPAAAAAPKSTVAFAMEPVFNELKARASAELVKRINAIFRFDIKKDTTTRHWLLDLKNGSGSVTEVTASTKADCIIGISDADCVNLFAGKLNAQQAFMKQQLTLKGNMMLAQKLQLLQSAPSKL